MTLIGAGSENAFTQITPTSYQSSRQISQQMLEDEKRNQLNWKLARMKFDTIEL